MPKEKRRLPRPRPIPVFNKRFRGALIRFGADLLETSEIKNTSIKGTKREDAFRKFWAERLPQRYGVAAGEVVDQLNSSGPQLDVLVYDRTRDFSFSDGDIHILPAEALLASIEVKSKLDANEVAKSCKAAKKLRALCPFRAPLGGRDIGATTNQPRQARYYHCVFAYDTDLAQTNWIKTEARRFHSHENGNEHLIDAVYVLRRGLLNLGHKSGRTEDEAGGAITSFYFSLLNFIQREGARRQNTPYHDYAAALLKGEWVALDI
jgi:hypothetical protein